MSEDDMPMPKPGGYTINWDELDENTNPFQSKSKLNANAIDPRVSYDLEAPASAHQTLPDIDPMMDNSNTLNLNSSEISSADSFNNVENELLVTSNGGTVGNANSSQDITVESFNSTVPNSSVSSASPTKRVDTTELITARKENQDLRDQIQKLNFCLLEYQRSLQYVLDQKEKMENKSNDPVAQIISERDQALKELTTLERAFTELHGRFDRAKFTIDKYKQNEKKLQDSMQEMEQWLQRQEQRYNLLEKNCKEELTKMNETCQTQKKEHESELTRLQVNLRRSELRMKSLETELEQQKQNTAELAAICDDLISKYSNDK